MTRRLCTIAGFYKYAVEEEMSRPRAAYISDGRWLGLAVYRPNRRLLRALTALQADQGK